MSAFNKKLNAILSNFSAPGLQTDTGALWENFLVSERRKVLHYHGLYGNNYFWRTIQQQEIDYLEERDGHLEAYEFKWKTKGKTRLPKTFSNAYPDSSFQMITPGTFQSFIGVE